MKYFSFSNIGKRRANQDLIYVNENPDLSIFLLADGMGGYEYGDIAAQIAIESIGTLISSIKIVDFLHIQKAVNKANLAIKQFNSRNNSKCGCTLGGVIFFKGLLYIFWIGDVRILHFKNKQLVFESKDHTLVNQLKNSGSITDIFRLSKYKHIVTRSIHGDIKDSNIDYHSMEVQNEDDNLLIICSDGVHDVLSSFDIQNTLHSSSDYSSAIAIIQNRLLLEAEDNNSILAINL